MKPYGWKQFDYRDEDHGPCSRYAKVSSKNRRLLRRLMHKLARRVASDDIQSQQREEELSR